MVSTKKNPQKKNSQWYKDFALWTQFFIQFLFLVSFSASPLSNAHLSGFTPTVFMDLCIPWILFILLLVQRFYLRTMLWLIMIVMLVCWFIPPTTVSILGGLTIMRQAYLVNRYMKKAWLWIAAMLIGSASFVYTHINYIFPALEESDRENSPNIDALLWTIVAVVCIGFFSMLGRVHHKKDIEIQLVHEKSEIARRQAQYMEEQVEYMRQRAELAALTERTRIAREMHDIIAHSLTAIIALADGGRFAGLKKPDQAVHALEIIASTGRESLAEMRSLLSVLREEDTRSFDKEPGMEDVDALIHTSRNLGLRINYEVSGQEQAISRIIGLTVFRIIQEALTNAAKHAGHTDVDMKLHWGKEALVLDIENPITDKALVHSHGHGQGLKGIQERVSAVGGDSNISNDGEKFSLYVRIPYSTKKNHTEGS